MIKMSSHTIGILSVFAVCACAYTPEELGQFLRVGLSNIQRETIDGPTTIEGTVPTWLEGNFVRHACGSFGHTESRDKNLPNYIGHLFDCMEIGQKFRIQNGTVTFTNKWYDTVVNDIYNYYHRDMNLSSVFLVSTYSKTNPGQVDAWRANFSSTSKVPEVPHVSWWQVGNQAIAMSETPIGVVVDPNSLQQHGNAQYTDQNMGFPDTPAHGFTNNPAHEHTEPDGTLWSTVISTTWLGPTKLNLKRVVYKVGADRYRHVVGQYDYGTADLTLCHGRSRYPDPALRPGYLHSFCMTENYIILPEAAYMFDPCAYTHYDGHVPFFPQAFSFEPRAFSRLLVMRRSDGTFVGEAHLQPFFVTHQLGSYEVNGEARLDMLMYDDASVYDKITYVDALLGPTS
ncbi:NINAB-like protein [Mya arenaria]|uniref:NINAB-like protein n=1 Tax=Mya arenaria TaxID=6604 RepID=A0ABY7ESA5_MYAAR|nr:NINAB-like protein [Mya arenaria]